MKLFRITLKSKYSYKGNLTYYLVSKNKIEAKNYFESKMKKDTGYSELKIYELGESLTFGNSLFKKKKEN